jgi:MFS family permease
VISSVAYGSLFFVQSPLNKAVFGQMVLVGFGEIGMIVTSLSMATSQVPRDIRGSVAGCYSLFGGLGVLFLTKVGGYLFDNWTETAPFLIVGLVSGVVALGAILMLIRRHIVGYVSPVSSMPRRD